MLEQNVDCTIVEEGDEDACIMKSVVKTIREISYYTFYYLIGVSNKIRYKTLAWFLCMD